MGTVITCADFLQAWIFLQTQKETESAPLYSSVRDLMNTITTPVGEQRYSYSEQTHLRSPMGWNMLMIWMYLKVHGSSKCIIRSTRLYLLDNLLLGKIHETIL